MMEAATLAAISSIRHGFFTRIGGVSTDLYDSLNCGPGSDDERGAVIANRARCAKALGVDAGSLVTLHQEHTADVVTVTAPWTMDDAPVADGLVTNQPGIALAVLAADCTPVLFADPTARVIGAAHAGWKGALTGVVENTIAAMTKLGAIRDTIQVAVGPCIGAASYEVGPEFSARFLDRDPRNAKYFKPSSNKGHSYFDVGGFTADRAAAAGVASVDRIDADTYIEEQNFYSYRRSCHRDEPDYGRQLSGIALVP
ncbi:MAG: peptidoglycan editing factor PgeF [Alphaproteobacteria bacterium]|nr:peptidoglycan editing factor PgeF [Alphaproteobacteria bacterium]